VRLFVSVGLVLTKEQIMKKTNYLLSTLLASSTCVMAQTTIVDFGGDYVSADSAYGTTSFDELDNSTDLGYGTATADGHRQLYYDDSNSIMPSSPTYTGPDIFAAFNWGQIDNTAFSNGDSSFFKSNERSHISEAGANDQIHIGSNNGRFIGAVMMFDPTSPSTYGDLESLSMNVVTMGNNNAESLHFMIRSGGQYYVSESNLGTDTTGIFNLDDTELSTENWAPVTLNDGAFTNLNYTTTGGSTLGSLDVIDQFGLYFETTVTENGTSMAFDSFEVVAIPEPSSFMLLTLALAGFCFFARRQ
jgi:hypothetical protein